MKLDHINLTVQDVPTASTFFKTHFGYEDFFDDNNDNMAVLHDGSGMHINLMKGKSPSYPKLFHIGFDLETEANVNAMYAQLSQAGIADAPPQHAWGAWTFHFTCPGSSFVVEVACEKVTTAD
ncbi:MAG: VOC family protein [Deinococcota bacterium]